MLLQIKHCWQLSPEQLHTHSLTQSGIEKTIERVNVVKHVDWGKDSLLGKAKICMYKQSNPISPNQQGDMLPSWGLG